MLVFCSASRKVTFSLLVEVLHDLEHLFHDLRRQAHAEGSSSSTIFGLAISARPMAHICCSPPEV
jgi:hypothetical protein